MIMLSPIAIGYYMDTLLKGRYRKIFGVVENIAFLNLLICSVLHILGIVDYIESLPVAHMILVGTVLIVFITMICDLKRGYVSEKYTFLSIILAMAAAVTESLLFQSFYIGNLYRNRNAHTVVYKSVENDQKYSENGKPASES